MGTENFYEGTNYGLDPGYGASFKEGYGNFSGYRTSSGSIGFPTNFDSANQLKHVSDKLSTGAKTIEVSGVNIRLPGGHMGLVNAIPKQQFEEIKRLKNLVGADLTFHGPLLELSGMDSRGAPFEETDRQQSQREMWSVVQKGHEMSPETNIPIVFHAANTGFGQYEKRVKNEVTGEEEIVDGILINTETGQLAKAPPPQEEFLEQGGKIKTFEKRVEDLNKETWQEKLQRVNFSAEQATNGFRNAKRIISEIAGSEERIKKYLEHYNDYVKNPEKSEEFLNSLPKEEQGLLKNTFNELTYADIYVNDVYKELKKLYDEVYPHTKGKEKEILDKYRNQVAHKVEDYKKNPLKIGELGETVTHGIATLRKIDQTPEILQPLGSFATDKAAETVSNVAIKSINAYGNKSPVIAIENPPADKFPMSRADELANLIETSRSKFEKKAVKPKSQGGLGLSKSEAERAAEKFIGLTWDTAHINMIRSQGYTKEDVIKEAEIAAPYVKHIHISDNFGLGDEELPPGWGDSPIPDQLKQIEKYNKDAKKIMEAGSWYSGLQFKHTPVLETFSALGSPVYAMQMSPYWNQAAVNFAPYYSGIGQTNPSFHHQVYGAGFSNLPIELGGQMAGASRSSGGTPFE